jgi:enoyl-CoA hydratase/carnithine racemase
MEDTEPEAVQIEKPVKGITIITINRQKRKNAVDSKTAAKLYQALIAFEDDEEQKVCVFHGAHGTFCSGADLHAVAQSQGLGREEPPFTNVAGRNIGPMGPSRLQVKKPVIAAVSGYAVAGGLELSLLADMRVVEEDAVFGVFCRRWGVPLIDGGTVRLQAVVGLGRAMDMILVSTIGPE